MGGFDLAFDEKQSNYDIFKSIGKPLVHRCVEMESSGTLFAYGQTGAGKTFSVAGSAGFIDVSKGLNNKVTGTKKGLSETRVTAKNAAAVTETIEKRIPGLVQLTAEEIF